jgi:hypothetical protein
MFRRDYYPKIDVRHIDCKPNTSFGKVKVFQWIMGVAVLP